MNERVEQKPNAFCERIAEEVDLQARRYVDVFVLFAQVTVVVGVVPFVSDGKWHDNRQVAQHAQGAVTQGVLVTERQVVTDLVNGNAKRVVQRCTYAVRQTDDRKPRGLTEEIADEKLEQHLGRHDVGDPGVGAHQLLDLGMLLEDGVSPRGVRLFRVFPRLVVEYFLLYSNGLVKPPRHFARVSLGYVDESTTC